jgi:hypothetical protein
MAKVHAVLCAIFESASYKPRRQDQGDALRWQPKWCDRKKTGAERGIRTVPLRRRMGSGKCSNADVTVRSPLADAELERYKNGVKDDVTGGAALLLCSCACSCACSCLARQCQLFAVLQPSSDSLFFSQEMRATSNVSRMRGRVNAQGQPNALLSRSVRSLNAALDDVCERRFVVSCGQCSDAVETDVDGR